MAGFLDDLKQVISNLLRRSRKGVDTLAVAVDQRTEAAKLTAKIRKLNRDRSDTISGIGKKVYSLHTQGKVKNKDVLTDCEQIDKINVEIAQIREEIEAIRRGGADELDLPELEDDAPLVGDQDVAATATVEPEPVEPEIEEEPVEAAPGEEVLEPDISLEVPSFDGDAEPVLEPDVIEEAPEEPADDDEDTDNTSHIG